MREFKRKGFKQTLIALGFVFTSLHAYAGTVLDDVFNIVSGGEYHREYERAKAEVGRDIARENRKLQSSLRGIERDSAVNLLDIYEKQYELVKLNLDRGMKLIGIHTALMNHLDEVLEARLSADRDIYEASQEARELNDTYSLLTSVDRVPFDRNYLANIQETWWRSMSELEALSKERSQSTSEFLKAQYAQLDADSLEDLYVSLANFSKRISSLTEYYRAQANKLGRQYNIQLKKAQALGGVQDRRELVLDEE